MALLASRAPMAVAAGLVFAAVAGLGPLAAAEDGFRDLFDGKSLQGWTVVGVGDFKAEEGEIRVRSQLKSFLRSEATYGDFILEAEVNVEPGGNSGIQVRSHVNDKGVLYGYQAEVDTSERAWSGGLYDEGRRAWLHPLKDQPERQKAFRNGEWNRYRVQCEGDHIQIWVNGVQTTDYRDSLDLEGHIALQHHGEKDKLYRFRKVRLKDLGRSVWRPLFDGKSLAGWKPLIENQWKVEDGEILGRCAKSELRHGLLFHERDWSDFTLRLRTKAIEGNSGCYFRVERDPGPYGAKGLQAEINATGEGVGGLYETSGRGWVIEPRPEDTKKWFKPKDWNLLSISAHGKRVVVHLNGNKSAEVADDPGRLSGAIALQLHGEQDMELRFKDIEVLEKVK